MRSQTPEGNNCFIKRKCGAESFICKEALDCRVANKQYSTPVWQAERHNNPYKAMSVLLTLLRKKLSRFPYKDKSDYTFIKYVCHTI